MSGCTRCRAREGAEAATHFCSEGSPPTHRGNKESEAVVDITDLSTKIQPHSVYISVHSSIREFCMFVGLFINTILGLCSFSEYLPASKL